VGFRGTWRELFWNHDFLDLMARRLDLGRVRDALDARNDEKVWLEQELGWAAEDASVLSGSRDTNWRFFEAGGGDEARFEVCWQAVRRWMALVREGVGAGRYASARAS